MAKGEATGASAPHAEEREPAYEGLVGRTRLRSVHVTLPSGFVRLVQVYDRINVATDPHLREAVISGGLHRFDNGEALAVPFVYHDPKEHKLALVVPELLRHRELELRSKLLAELADDVESPIPNYVAEGKTVVGIPALGAYLESKPSLTALRELDAREATLGTREAALAGLGEQLDQRQSDIDIREDALAQREERLHLRAEQVTRREDELRLYSEELDAARADLGMREQELEARMEMLQQREEELASRSGSEALEESARRAIDDDVVHIVNADELRGVIGEDDVEEIEEIEEIEPLETSPGSELVKAIELADAPLDPGEAIEEIDDEVEEIVDDLEDLEEVREVDDVTGLHAIPEEEDETIEPLAASSTQVSQVAGAKAGEPPPPASEPPPGPSPSVTPPPSFFERHGANAATLEADAVRIFAKLAEGKEDTFEADSEADLLAQLVVVEECPVVLLTVVDQVDSGRPRALRAPVDPRSDQGRELLEALQGGFRARVALFDSRGTYLRTIDASGPREANALRVIERVSKMRTAAAVDVPTAIDRVLSAPPPVSAKDSPFLPDGERAAAESAGSARAALEAIERWNSHEKMDHAVLTLSIPCDDVEGTTRHVLEQAVSHGLPLSPRLQERAVALGVAEDAAALVARQVEAFSDTTRPRDRGGLSAEEAARGWETLLESAAEAEVAIDTATHEQAWKLIRAVRGGDAEDIDPEAFPELGIPQLVMLLEHPRYRCEAAIEIARRGDADLAPRLCKAVRKMPRSEVVRVVPRILDLGDGAGDALIDGLGARKTFVRQAFALSLGQLELRRAVVPLLHLLGSEESEVWREVARVLGTFGTASVRTITRQLKDPKGPEERYVATLAHLANHGCEKQVEKLAESDRPSVASMAVESLTLRQMARTAHERAIGKMPLAKRDKILEFSRRFYAELEGKASESALDD